MLEKEPLPWTVKGLAEADRYYSLSFWVLTQGKNRTRLLLAPASTSSDTPTQPA